MKTKLIGMIAGLLLILGASIALPAEPVAAHNYDGWSQYYCIKHRPSNTSVVHSWPAGLGPNEVLYWCQAWSLDSNASWQYWVRVYGGPGSPYSVRPWDYQPCSSVPCGSPGHS